MFSNNEKISLRQMQILVIMYLFGSKMISLPATVTEFGKRGWWLILIGIFALTLIYAGILNSLAKMFENETIVEYGKKLLPKVLYFIIIIGLILKMTLDVSMEIRMFSEIVKEHILYETPREVVLFTLLLISAYMARSGIEAEARMGELLVIILIPLVIIFSIVAFQVDYINLRPIFEFSHKDILNGIKETAFVFNSLEFILFIYPVIIKKKEVGKSLFTALILIFVVDFLITLMTIAHFGIIDVQHHIWPVMQMLQSINFPNAIFERVDIFINTFWILSIFMYSSINLYIISSIFARLTKTSKTYPFVLPLLPIVYIIAFIPKNLIENYEIIKKINFFMGILYLVIIPIVLLLVAKLKKAKKRMG